MRVDGYQENACWVKGLGNKIYYGLEYSFTIEVKDNRVRLSFEPINLLGGTNKSPFIASSLYNDQGELRGYVKDLVPSLEETMKGLKDSYAKYVSKSKKDEW